MMTSELEASILSAPLAAIDRRTLSQAWYSALHVAQQNRPQPLLQGRALRPADSSKNALAGRGPAARSGDDAASRRTPASAPQPRSVARATSAAIDYATLQRRRSTLSRRIELRFAGNPAPIARATFSFGTGAARVHVIMQRNGDAARLVAICRPHMRAAVARALADARIALSARGTHLFTKSMVVCSAALEMEPCS